ncbi:MAG: bacillithiol system redox-active protein YtxJ, partial [Deltaproteobacteria bacterium]|nr:bacillithiol system redox-active protein YtxJ [Deltaproteobacteria bacterium]
SLVRACEEPWALVFKHATRCPVSTPAHHQVAEFRRRNPAAADYVLYVVEQRPLSLALAGRTGVRHESPQAIVLAAGTVVWSGSHESVTADTIEALLPQSVGS